MGHRGIGQHPLDVRLGQRHHVSHRHRRDGQEGQDRDPARDHPGSLKPDQEDPQDHGQGRRLRPGRHEPRHRRGRSLVHVWDPEVKRDGADLEGKAHQDQAHADEGPRIDRRVQRHREDPDDPLEIDAPGRPVQEGDAVKNEGRGEGAQEEVLQRRLDRLLAIPGEPGEGVKRKGKDLEPEEDHQEVFARRHQDHAEDRCENQDEIFS